MGNGINKNKCELCNMNATHSEMDIQNVEHFFCEHHSITKILPHSNSMNNIGSVKLNNTKKLTPLFLVIFGIFLLSLVRQYIEGINFMIWMMDFMGIFFITFGLFKLYDLKGFVEGFKTYDIIAKRFTVFGHVFPFLEIFLGAMYLLGFMFIWQNMIALTLAGFGLYSAYIVLKNKEEIQCVCLGTAFNIPMTYVTLLENGAMFIMVLFMLLM